jgi:RNA polymerase sigma factor (sigma-70 family)
MNPLLLLEEDLARVPRSRRWTALLLRAQEGDREAFDALTEDAEQPLWRHALALVGDGSLADDVVAATFEKVWRYLDRYDPTRSNARTWIYRIARQVAQDHYERRARRRRTEVTGFEVLFGGGEEDEATGLEPEDVLAPEPAAEADRPHREALVREALAGLRAGERELLTWFHGEGLSYEEIAARLGCSPSAVGPRLTRARKRLREALDPEARE